MMLTTVAALAVAASTLSVSAAPKPAPKPEPASKPRAASITTTSACNAECHVIYLNGDIGPTDAKRFREEVEKYKIQRAVVILNSGGGAAMDGLEIGELIRERGFSTFVRKGEDCESSCALIWASGSTQYAASEGGSHIGFHGVYSMYVDKNGYPVKDTKPEASPSGNAMVGAYLWQLGYGYKAIKELTKSAPDEMFWLTTQEQMTALGFNLKFFSTSGDYGTITAGNYSVSYNK
jgi:hypothetical protein